MLYFECLFGSSIDIAGQKKSPEHFCFWAYKNFDIKMEELLG
jgi:hypothetical protein